MTTWTEQTKKISAFTGQTKNAATFIGQTKNTTSFTVTAKHATTFNSQDKSISADFFDFLIDGTHFFLIENSFHLKIGGSTTSPITWNNQSKS